MRYVGVQRPHFDFRVIRGNGRDRGIHLSESERDPAQKTRARARHDADASGWRTESIPGHYDVQGSGGGNGSHRVVEVAHFKNKKIPQYDLWARRLERALLDFSDPMDRKSSDNPADIP